MKQPPDMVTRAIELGALALFRRDQAKARALFEKIAKERSGGDRLLELQIKANGPTLLPWDEIPEEIRTEFREVARTVIAASVETIFNKVSERLKK